MRHELIWAVLLAAISATVFANPIRVENDGWSKSVSGIQARFSFEEGNLVNGTRLTEVYVELRNVSDVGNPIYLRYDPTRSIKAQLFNSAGKPVSIAGNPASIKSLLPFLICLPYDSTLKLNVTAKGYGVPKDQKALIGLHSGDWLIEKSDSTDYFLRGTFISEQPKKETKQRLWNGKIQIPWAKVDVVKGDAAPASRSQPR